MIINEDGSVQWQTFSQVKLPYPHPKYNNIETYAGYRDRVDQLVKQGFHLGDLSWGDWSLYCMGSGQFDGVNSNDKI